VKRRTTRHTRDASRWYAALGVTTILVLAAVGVIAYRANTGLPWESRYVVSVDVPDGNRLITSADVRIGGVRVGEVLSTQAMPRQGAAPPYARLKLALEHSAGPLPVDTTVQVRPASVLGLTYVDLRLGRSRRTIRGGGTLPVSAARSTVDLTDLLSIFDRSGARGFQGTMRGLSGGLAGRGGALGGALASTAGLLPPLTDVASVLASTPTRLAPFLRSYESTVQALAPISPRLAGLVSGAATTLRALAGERTALGAAIDAAPGAESATTVAFGRAQPALDGLARLAVDLRPAGRDLPTTLEAIDRTLSAGLAPLRAFPGFSTDLRTALRTLYTLARDPTTDGSLRKLDDLVAATNEVLTVAVPAQVDCNAIALWGQDFSSVFGAIGDGQGPSLPNLVLETAGASGEAIQNARPSSNLGLNPLPNETAGECESGNEPWTGKQQLNNPPGMQSRATKATVPPPGVTALARGAGLLAPVEGKP
jgi:virulence factor Mce-like protein